MYKKRKRPGSASSAGQAVTCTCNRVVALRAAADGPTGCALARRRLHTTPMSHYSDKRCVAAGAEYMARSRMSPAAHDVHTRLRVAAFLSWRTTSIRHKGCIQIVCDHSGDGKGPCAIQ